jgi:dephospho-CoA kinase
MIIGLTGPMASGKTTVLDVLKKLGYQHVTLSDMVREEARRLGVKEERENLMNVGQSLRREHGAGVLAFRAMAKIKSSGGDKWVIDGIRNPAEIDEIKKESGTVIIANTAPEELIIKRIMSRKRADDTFDEISIRKKLRREMGEGEPEDGQQVGKCIEMADFVFKNTMPFEKVEEEFMKLYNQITNK